jgi:ribosomal protein S18
MSTVRRGPAARKTSKKRTRVRTKTKKKDPLFVEGKRPRPMYVDYKDVELLSKLIMDVLWADARPAARPSASML